MSVTRAKEIHEERLVIAFDHPQVTGTTTWKAWKVPTGRRFRVDSAQYINPTGLVGDAANAFTGEVKNGSTVIASLFNTETDNGGASLAADTFVDGTLSATAANLVLAEGDILSLVATEVGAATLPPGRLVVEGRYV